MKTAIYLPDDILRTAEKVARRLKITMDQLYATALKEYIDQLDAEHITEKLDTLYAQEDSNLDNGLSRTQRQALKNEEW